MYNTFSERKISNIKSKTDIAIKVAPIMNVFRKYSSQKDSTKKLITTERQ